MDARNDGLCCNHGMGTYIYSVNGITEYDSSKRRTFTSKATHAFYVGLPVPENNGNGNSGIENQNNLVFEPENSWELCSLTTNEVVAQKGLGSFPPNSLDFTEVCVQYGKYQFTLKDGVGDGICCDQQGDGRYEIYMDDEHIIYGSDFTYGKEVRHVLIAGYHLQLNQMSQREIQYLIVTIGVASITTIKYDMSLADNAQDWADALFNDCHIDGNQHEPGVEQGENLANNMGSSSSNYQDTPCGEHMPEVV